MSIKNEQYYEDLLYKIDLLRLDDIHSNNLIEMKKIGTGGFGKVMRGNYLSLPVAIKKMKNFNYEQFYKEIDVIRKFRHLNVPNLYFISKQGNTLNIVSELINGRTLDQYINKIKPSEIEIIVHMLELATVLNHFHNFNMIHRDLKPSNVMVDTNLDIKLLDFGISKITQNRSFTTTLTMGTILYMAPENFDSDFLSGQTLNELTKCRITGRVDVWAFGCMLSEIFSKCKPWTPLAQDDTLVMSHLYSKSKFPIPEKIDKKKNEKIVNLIEKCTIVNECERYNFFMVIKSLRNILHKLACKKMNNFDDDHNYLKPKNSINGIIKSLDYFAK